MKHMKKENTLKKYISNIIGILFLICILISTYKIMDWVTTNKKTQKMQEKISIAVSTSEDKDENQEQKEQEKYNIDFKMLKEINKDTIGWIKVNGTEIEHSVVKHSNNDFYLKHSFDKTYNSAGWIFADYRNKIDGTDKNIIIYGHNRRDGSMFSPLKNILNSEWYEKEENRKVIFITESEKMIYEVFSVYQIKAENYYTTTNFSSDAEFKEFINKIKSRSIVDFNVDVNETDNILTLSTCANDSKYRVVLHAKKDVEGL